VVGKIIEWLDNMHGIKRKIADMVTTKRVKQSRYRPGVAQRVPGS